MISKQTGVIFLCFLILTAVPVAVTAADFNVTTNKTIDVVDRTEEQGGSTYEITEVTQVDPKDTITVSVDAPAGTSFEMFLYDKDQNPINGYEETGATDFEVNVTDDGATEAGTYAFVIPSEAVHPLVVRGYSVSADSPETVTNGDSISIDGEFTKLRGEDYSRVDVVVASTDTDERNISTASVDDNSFSKSVTTDGLEPGSYDVYAVVRGSDMVLDQREILGLSSPQLLEIEAEDSETEDSDSSSSESGSSGSTGGGGGAPADTSDESDTTEPPAQASLADGPVSRSVADADPDTGGVNVEVNAGPVGQVSFDAPSDAATGEMTVSQSPATTDTFAAQFGQERVKTAVSIDVPAELANTTATVQFQLSDEDLGDTAVDDLQVVKNTAGGSQVLSSSTATENGSVVITARTPGFSEFAVIEAPSETSSTTDEEESTAETTTDDGGSNASGDEESDEPADESTDTNTPGFGPLVALIALLAAALSARYKR